MGSFSGEGERGDCLILVHPGSVRAVPTLGVGGDNGTELGRDARALCKLLRR